MVGPLAELAVDVANKYALALTSDASVDVASVAMSKTGRGGSKVEEALAAVTGEGIAFDSATADAILRRTPCDATMKFNVAFKI